MIIQIKWGPRVEKVLFSKIKLDMPEQMEEEN
jgi:hypothetical protein